MTQLPKDIRTPINELQADLAYLLSFAGTAGPLIEAAIRGKLDAIEKATFRALEAAA